MNSIIQVLFYILKNKNAAKLYFAYTYILYIYTTQTLDSVLSPKLCIAIVYG